MVAPFQWGAGGARMTPDQITSEKKIANALMQQGMDYSPVQHWSQGAARVAQALMGGLDYRMADEAGKRNDAESKSFLTALFPGAGSAPVAQSPAAAPATAGGTSNFGNAIASIESGGRYDALGPVIPKTGDRAYGKYQVMGANIPQWTKALLGQEMTPQAFVASPEAQDAVFKGKFGEYVNKYGPEGAAKAWFAGEGGMKNPNARDVLGTSVSDYARKFVAALGPQAAVSSDVSSQNRPTQGAPQPPAPGMNPAIIQALTSPYASDSVKGLAKLMFQQQMEQQVKAADPMRQLQMDKLRAETSKLSGATVERGLNPQFGVDAQGNPVILQLGKDGSAVQTRLPSGVSLSKEPIRLDAGTHHVLLDPITRQQIGIIPKNLAEAEAAKASGRAKGADLGTYESMVSKMPGLESVVRRLDDLSSRATYTYAGQALDSGMRQMGMQPRDSAIARSEYTAIVDNQILPLLRDTFGAQFTEREGATLRATLGDPKKSPPEKQALLRAFIEQKRRDIEALATRTGQASAPNQAPAGNASIDDLLKKYGGR